MLLSDQNIKEKNQTINENMHRNKWKQKQDNPKTSGFSKISAKGKIHRNTSLPQETRETSNKWPNFTTKATRKRGSEEPQD